MKSAQAVWRFLMLIFFHGLPNLRICSFGFAVSLFRDPPRLAPASCHHVVFCCCAAAVSCCCSRSLSPCWPWNNGLWHNGRQCLTLTWTFLEFSVGSLKISYLCWAAQRKLICFRISFLLILEFQFSLWLASLLKHTLAFSYIAFAHTLTVQHVADPCNLSWGACWSTKCGSWPPLPSAARAWLAWWHCHIALKK